jgi:adenylate cyclase
VPLDDANRLWAALGLLDVGDDAVSLTQLDLDGLRDAMSIVGTGGVHLEDLVTAARPVGQLLARLAEAHASFIANTVQSTSRPEITFERGASGGRGDARQDAGAAADVLVSVLERTTIYAWRRHLAAAATRGTLDRAGSTQASPCAVGFVDISEFTRLSRRLDRHAFVRVLDRFESVVSDEVVAAGGRVVKSMGDGVLFTTADASAAAEVALSVLDAFPARPSGSAPAVHAGLAWGSVLARSGDVYGPVVNVAARLTELAGRGTVRVDRAMALQLAGCDGVELVWRRPRVVRGYTGLRSSELHRAPGSVPSGRPR